MINSKTIIITLLTDCLTGTEANISRELEEITNLYNFGLQLGIDSKVLDRIDREHRSDIERQRSEIVKYWYRNTAESECTWGRIADAIGRLGGHSNLEMKLRQLGTTLAGITNYYYYGLMCMGSDHKFNDTTLKALCLWVLNLAKLAICLIFAKKCTREY